MIFKMRLSSECRLFTVLILLCLSIVSCGRGKPYENIYNILDKKSWQAVKYEAGGFKIFGLLKQTGKDDTLVVYIEGDGFAWKNRYTLSSDPTPKNPIALYLAVCDTSLNVLYLGRPCQYLQNAYAECHPRYWSSHRYSKEVIKAMDEVITRAKNNISAKNIALIGFSGGGTVAALIAAHRNDTTWIVTICANLDHAKWTSYHRITPLKNSMNPADFAEKIQHIPQIHFVGDKDNIVPESIAASFRNQMSDTSLTDIVVIKGYDHHCCWVKSWIDLQKQIYRRMYENKKNSGYGNESDSLCFCSRICR